MRVADAVPGVVAGLPVSLAEIDVVVANARFALGLEPAHRADLAQWTR